MITGVFIAAAAVCVLAIAAIVIGREARRLDAVAPRAVYDLDQAAAGIRAYQDRMGAGKIVLQLT